MMKLSNKTWCTKFCLLFANSNGLEVGGFHIRVDITGKDIEVW